MFSAVNDCVVMIASFRQLPPSARWRVFASRCRHRSFLPVGRGRWYMDDWRRIIGPTRVANAQSSK